MTTLTTNTNVWFTIGGTPVYKNRTHRFLEALYSHLKEGEYGEARTDIQRYFSSVSGKGTSIFTDPLHHWKHITILSALALTPYFFGGNFANLFGYISSMERFNSIAGNITAGACGFLITHIPLVNVPRYLERSARLEAAEAESKER